jgi:hypothetical protein
MHAIDTQAASRKLSCIHHFFLYMLLGLGYYFFYASWMYPAILCQLLESQPGDLSLYKIEA